MMEKEEEKYMNKPHEPEEQKILMETEADDIIRKHIYISMGVGLLPLPFLDFVGVAGVQLNMLRKLAELYRVPFSKDIVKNLIGSLIGGSFPASVGAKFGGTFAKIIPGVGHLLGAASVSAAAGASTYAIGKVFKRHFAEGGTFLSFDVKNARAFYEQMFKEGQHVTDEIKQPK